MKKILTVISLAILLAGCAPHNSHRHANKADLVHEYRHHDAGLDTWMYWYILTSGNNTYYYSTPNQISTFSSVNFTKAPAAGLPADVNKAIEESELVETAVVSTDAKPANVEQEEEQVDTTEAQSEAMTSEGGPAPAESTSTESGGGDSGGGGGDGGGGGSD